MNRLIPVGALLAGLCGITGCAVSAPPEEPLPRLDMAEVRQMLDCPHDLTAVCTERVGKPYHCFCADRDALARILEPDKY